MKRSLQLSGFSIAAVYIAMAHSSFAQQSVDAPRFAAPVRIEANGKPIDVTTGHAAPYVYDFDGDGTRDLLVGEFGSGTFKGEAHMELSHSWCKGRLRIYRNHGTDKAPVFRDFEYFKGGGKIAAVPITCCVSFVPQFVDYDNDGTDDVLSASYPGDMYWWKGAGDGTYGNRPNAAPVMGVSDATDLFLGRGISCAIRTTGAVLCWGRNSSMVLGDPAFTESSSPLPRGVPGLAAVTEGSGFVRTNSGFLSAICAAAADGVACWGPGSDGRSGDGTTDTSNRAPPVRVLGFP